MNVQEEDFLQYVKKRLFHVSGGGRVWGSRQLRRLLQVGWSQTAAPIIIIEQHVIQHHVNHPPSSLNTMSIIVVSQGVFIRWSLDVLWLIVKMSSCVSCVHPSWP